MIPRVIYAFWSGKKNRIVEACFKRMRVANPDWTVVILDNFTEADDIEGFDKMKVQAKTDWLRICLIEKYGGLWLDASTICVDHVESWLDLTEDRVVGFRAPMSTDKDVILENWAFAAKPNHPLIVAWKQEFANAIRMGFDQYKTTMDPEHPIFSSLPYLTQHAAYTRVHDPDLVFMYDVHDPRFGPFHHQRKHWNFLFFVPTYMMFLPNRRYPSLVKLTGGMRADALRALRIMPVLPNSLMHKTLGFHPARQLCSYVFVVVVFLVVCQCMRSRRR